MACDIVRPVIVVELVNPDVGDRFGGAYEHRIGRRAGQQLGQGQGGELLS
jgi:hypothetical protein